MNVDDYLAIKYFGEAIILIFLRRIAGLFGTKKMELLISRIVNWRGRHLKQQYAYFVGYGLGVSKNKWVIKKNVDTIQHKNR